MLQAGDKVPTGLKGILVQPEDIDNSGESSKKVSLSSLYKDNVLVLYFYPKDSTPGCTTEAQTFRDSLAEIKKLGATVVGCSRDEVKSHCRFMGKQEINFPLLSDDSGEITEAFGVWALKKLYGKEFMGILRSTFIIEKGKIIQAYPKVKVKEHASEVVDFLKARKG